MSSLLSPQDRRKEKNHDEAVGWAHSKNMSGVHGACQSTCSQRQIDQGFHVFTSSATMEKGSPEGCSFSRAQHTST